MVCPPVRGDTPRAEARDLSRAQVDNHGITTLYHLYQCRPCMLRGIDKSCINGKYCNATYISSTALLKFA